MEIQKKVNKESVYITVIGDMDLNDSNLLKHALTFLKRKTVIIDFTKVKYMGSVCLAKLIEAKKNNSNSRFIMFNCNNRIYSTFTMTGIDRFFEFQS
jgi:anti-anti-sigma factor